MSNVRRDTSKTFRKKELICEKNINEPETNNKNKNVRDLYTGISECKKY
jgi:hypothetical protein